MSKSNLRLAIITLTIITAVVHLALNLLRGLNPPFIANSLGYFALMVAFFKWVNLPFLTGREKLVWYVYMGFAAITIVAYFVVALNPLSDLLGLFTKAVELLLIGALWLHKEN
jgi:hypothetical protein